MRPTTLLGHAKLATRPEAGATIRELAAWSGAHRQTVVWHVVQGRSRFARVWGDCRGGGPCQRSRPDRRLVEWKYGRPRCAAAQSARPPTAEFDCDEVWTCEDLLSVFSITTGRTPHQFQPRINQQDEVLVGHAQNGRSWSLCRILDRKEPGCQPPQREPLRKLSRSERTALERMVRRNNVRVDVVRRASALLAVARTGVFIHAAHEAGLHSGTTVADLVARFNRRGLAALRIATGRGRRATYSASERARIVATAQRQPNRRTDGTATWSLSTLRRSLRRAGLPRVGTSTIRRVLQDAGSSYQRTRTWCPTGTAQRKRKSGVVTVIDPNTEEKRG